MLVKLTQQVNSIKLILKMSIASRQQRRPLTHCINVNQTYQKTITQTFKKNYINILHQQVPLPVPCVNFTQITNKLISTEKKIKLYLSVFSKPNNFSSVMGGVCKIWLLIHRNMLFTITNDFDFIFSNFREQSELR